MEAITVKVVELACPNCGAAITPGSGQDGFFCPYCGTRVLIDDETTRFDSASAEEAGYAFEQGRMRAQEEAAAASAPAASPAPKKRHLFWWVVGWIFFFPIPLTVIIVRSKLKPWLKILLLLLLWGLVVYSYFYNA